MGGSPTTQGSLIGEMVSNSNEDFMDRRPVVMQINPQQLKNSTKIARVLLVDENPISLVHTESMLRSSVKNNDHSTAAGL